MFGGNGDQVKIDRAFSGEYVEVLYIAVHSIQNRRILYILWNEM